MSQVEPPRVDETHLSWVFQAGDRAYKLLKPVTMPFLDHSSDAARIDAATTEFELNRRTAPDVYLGLADVREGDHLVDRMIVMRRLPVDRRLSRLAGQGDLRRSFGERHAARTCPRSRPPLHTASNLP